MLNVIRTGPEQGIPLVIAHGLYGSARNWGIISKRLSDQRPVITVDMRNHGSSPWYSSHNYADLADDLAEVIYSAGRQADVLGHSMGGKAAMVMALCNPNLVRRLIIADIAPVAYGHTQAHLIHAMQSAELSWITSRKDVDVQLADHIPEAGVRAFLMQSLDMKGPEPRWALNLDVLENDMPAIVGFPAISGSFSGETLFLTGGDSDYVLPEHHPTILEHFPNTAFHAVEGAGHWLHAEKPRVFEAEIRDFLNA